MYYRSSSPLYEPPEFYTSGPPRDTRMFVEFFEIIADHYQKNRRSLSELSYKEGLKKPFTLIEDVKLWLYVYISNYKQYFDEKMYISLAQILKDWGFQRTFQSLRDRYKRFLRRIPLETWPVVLKHVRKYGLEGIILFCGPKNRKKFYKVTLFNPWEKKKKDRSKENEMPSAMEIMVENWEEE